MTVVELAAFAERLTTLTVTPEERAAVLATLGAAMQHIFDTAAGIATAVAAEHPKLIGTPADPVVIATDEAGEYAAKARDAFHSATEAVEDLTQERQALIDAGELPGPDGRCMTASAREALAYLQERLAGQQGVAQ
ncbi:hypothetical protein [Streptosporangium canum]|nr:hypothetical protein [Streptosporangium canum]